MPAYRAAQVLEWVYRHGVTDPAQMTNLGKADQRTLAERLSFIRGGVLGHQRATDGTQKLLVDWSLSGEIDARAGALPVLGDKASQTECVMIPADEAKPRRTACISSQVGCPVGCKFCASGLGGLDGNLTAGQIVQQVWQLGQLEGVGRISHVVFMGMGEPLSNFGEVTRAVRTITADWGLGISGRRITVSTVGLPAQIRRLAELDIPITLAVSLHAPNDALRRQLIPWAESVTIQQLIDAGRFYFDKSGREVTLEYILLGQVNDRPEHARELAQVAKKLRSNINLIRYNEVAGLPFARPTDNDVLAFQQTLRSAGVNTHIRASRGRDIAAACGQLRHEHRGPAVSG
ncbi:MAG: 23S rRNA (adenine(2503)-C(2))-methyltransferase RlmN [Phycisphaerales bacterium]